LKTLLNTMTCCNIRVSNKTSIFDSEIADENSG
jgi:hypothetical protein